MSSRGIDRKSTYHEISTKNQPNHGSHRSQTMNGITSLYHQLGIEPMSLKRRRYVANLFSPSSLTESDHLAAHIAASPRKSPGGRLWVISIFEARPLEEMWSFPWGKTPQARWFNWKIPIPNGYNFTRATPIFRKPPNVGYLHIPLGVMIPRIVIAMPS